MGFVTTPRLYRKRSGTYYLRIVVSASSRDAERRKRTEACCSLRTKNPARARQIAAWANARLALDQHLHDKKFIVDALFSNIRRWTIGDLTIDGPEDAKNFVHTMRELPDLRAATMMRIANCTDPEQLAELQRLLATLSAQLPSPSGPSPASRAGPAQPMRMLAAIDTYAASKQATAEVSARTARDKRNLLKALVAHLAAADPALGADPFVHDITTRHLSAFLDAVPVRRHRSESSSDAEKAAAPKTVIKKISDLPVGCPDQCVQGRQLTAEPELFARQRRDEPSRFQRLGQ